MCGICGALWTIQNKEINVQTLDRMTDRLSHRGPDDRGTLILKDEESPLVPNVCLGFRRLAILDLSTSGHQPMSNEDGTVWIVFNGEIYNFEPLRKELISKGHQFKSNTDTEVLIHLYEEEQENMLQKINGMFGFAIWDTRRKRLFLARDRIGKKPLYYRHENGRLIFASELKSIFAIPDVPKEVDHVAIDEYLTYQYIPYPRTIILGTSKLSPAHYAIWENNKLTVERYWNPDLNFQDNNLTINEWSEGLQSLLTDAVRIRMRSDVPLGAFLSGGIDSSIISGIMQQESNQQVQTFTIGFTDKSSDETEFARAAAMKFGTLHREFIVTSEIQNIFQKLAWHYDEPFADQSAIPTWHLCEQTKREVTVALSGDGGDELFAGYDRHRAAYFGERFDYLPLSLRRVLSNTIMRMIPGTSTSRSFFRKLQRFFEGLGMNRAERFLQWIAYFNKKQRLELYTDSFTKKIYGTDSIDYFIKALKRSERRDSATQLSLTDMQTYLPGAVMTKVDVASMAHSLECRAPFLDYRVTEWAAKIPINYKIQGNLGKIILRNTYKDLLPKIISKRRDKMGFGAPTHQWFRGELKNIINNILLDTNTTNRGIFRREKIEQLLTEHFSNRFDHSRKIWALFMLEMWFRTWIENGSVI
jgi:asparagine synthase (glutamine-hydrolysing)